MTHKQILLVIVGLMAAMFLSSLNQTVVGTAMKTIADDLDGLSLQAWVTTAFLIVSTVSTPIYGKLSDIFGRRPLFLAAIVIFLIGSLLSALANNMYELSIYRAVQGLGAGGLMALPLTVMGDILAPRERAKYQGYFLAVFGVSSVIGPLIGGLFAGAEQIMGIAGWRWVFLLNIPIGIVALVMVMAFLHVPHTARGARIDWWGAVLVVASVVPAILVAEQGRHWGWGSPIAIAMYATTVLATVAFILVERRMGDDALIPLKLFSSSTFSVATVLGVLIGGLFAGAEQIMGIAGWRWVFLLNIPIGIVALVMVMAFLHVPHTARGARIDWWGAVLVVASVVPAILVAEQGRHWGWGSPIAIAMYATTVLATVAFILVERRMGDDALIPLKLFSSSTFSVATVLGVLIGFGMFGAMMTIPLYLQMVSGATPTESGFLMLPMIGGLMVSSIVSGNLIAKNGRYKIFPVIGSGMLAASFLWLAFASADKPLWYILVGMAFAGLGLGQLMQTLTIASQNSVGHADMGVATSSATFFRQMGGTLGTAVVFSVLFGVLPSALRSAFGDPATQAGIAAAAADPRVLADPANQAILQLLQNPAAVGDSLNGDSSFLIGADPRLAAPFLEGFANASTTVFLVSFAVVLAAFVLSFFLKATPLREKSGIQEAHAAAS
ncbi:MFS transporter [Diaminobutyricimonas sp. LJ205]|uniref:MFS transporter n=1 Tax=Diaminobutyricimonas sp. LJ205 TaxID=2683590 RepID=UPI0012F4C695